MLTNLPHALPFTFNHPSRSPHLLAPSKAEPALQISSATRHLALNSQHLNKLTLFYAKFGDNLDAFTHIGKFFFLFEHYLEDIEQQTGLEIGEKQRALIVQALSTQTFSMVDFQTNKKLHRRFSRKKAKLIKKWEEETGETWPRYHHDVYNEKGNIIRFKGQPYDAHHIIECVFNGPAEWWNIHPAASPDEHQNGIHRANGPAWWIYFDNCQTEEGCWLFADEEERLAKAS